MQNILSSPFASAGVVFFLFFWFVFVSPLGKHVREFVRGRFTDAPKFRQGGLAQFGLTITRVSASLLSASAALVKFPSVESALCQLILLCCFFTCKLPTKGLILCLQHSARWSWFCGSLSHFCAARVYCSNILNQIY